MLERFLDWIDQSMVCQTSVLILSLLIRFLNPQDRQCFYDQNEQLPAEQVNSD